MSQARCTPEVTASVAPSTTGGFPCGMHKETYTIHLGLPLKPLSLQPRASVPLPLHRIQDSYLNIQDMSFSDLCYNWEFITREAFITTSSSGPYPERFSFFFWGGGIQKNVDLSQAYGHPGLLKVGALFGRNGPLWGFSCINVVHGPSLYNWQSFLHGKECPILV